MKNTKSAKMTPQESLKFDLKRRGSFNPFIGHTPALVDSFCKPGKFNCSCTSDGGKSCHRGAGIYFVKGYIGCPWGETPKTKGINETKQ